MSSSNLVSLTAIEEVDYGVTPSTGDFQTARFTMESLSGTPQTTKSTEIHSDRMASGQVQTGLDVTGDIDMELSADPLLEDFVRGAMMNETISAETNVTGKAIVIDPIGKTLQFEGSIDLIKGDLIFLTGFTEEKNNGMAYVTSVDATTITPAVPPTYAQIITASPSSDTDLLFFFDTKGKVAGTYRFGDGTATQVVSADEVASYTYPSAGTYTVTFTTVENYVSHLTVNVIGTFAEESIQAGTEEVANKPAIKATPTGTDFSFTFSIDGVIAGTFDFGDSSTGAIALNETVDHAFAGAGTYEVTFTDSQGTPVVSTLSLTVAGTTAEDTTQTGATPAIKPAIPAVEGFLVKVGKETIASETSPLTANIKKARKLTVGTDIVSFSICKNFLDLSSKSISYMGMIVNQMSLQMAYGAIAKANFGFMGNGYETPALPMTDGRTVTEASNTQPLNATSDIGTVFIDGQVAKFCVQNLNIELNNGLTPQQCMGRLTARQYSLGQATVNVSGSAYLADENWNLMQKKLTQQPVSIAYSAQNADGGIAVIAHGCQLSFPDSSAKGLDQQVSIEFTGSAKKVETGYFDIYFF